MSGTGTGSTTVPSRNLTSGSRQHTRPRTTTGGRQSPDIVSVVGSQHLSSAGHSSNSGSDDEEVLEKEGLSGGQFDFAKDKSKISLAVPRVPTEVNQPADEYQAFWTAERRALLYRIMLELDFSPIAPQRHLVMIGVHSRFCEHISKTIDPELIWYHLRCLYDLDGLDKVQHVDLSKPVRGEYKLPPAIQQLVDGYSNRTTNQPEENAVES